MFITILTLIVFSIFNALELYLAFKVGQGMKLSDVPLVQKTTKKVKVAFESMHPVHQNDVYEPTDQEYFENEKELEEEANVKIDEGLKILKQIKKDHD